MKKMISFLIAFTLLSGRVSAADLSFMPSTYNEWGEAVTGASGYQPIATVSGKLIGTGSWFSPADMAVSPGGTELYVLDSGNNRVTCCDSDFKNGYSIDVFKDGDNETALNGATGIFCGRDGIYIADKGNSRVIRCDTEGNILCTFLKPDSVLFPQEKLFLPTKVAVDGNGIVYVICEGIDQGAVMYSAEGEFLGYIGSNKIQVTVSVLLDSFIKQLVSREAQDYMAKYTPVEFNNLTIDNENFIYTCTNVQDVTSKIKKLNAGGINIFEAKIGRSFQKGFGDIRPPYIDGVTQHSRFVDVAVDENGCFYGLDFTNMRIFAYDENTNLLYSFGGPGSQMGLFMNPVAVEILNGNILVLDTNVCEITIFARTEFGNLVNTAMMLYKDGHNEESAESWKEVLKYNSNYTMAYIGLGKASLQIGNISDALENFKVAHYAAGYNEAFRIQRVDKIRSDFYLYFLIIVIFLLFVYRRSIPGIKTVSEKTEASVKRHLQRKENPNGKK